MSNSLRVLFLNQGFLVSFWYSIFFWVLPFMAVMRPCKWYVHNHDDHSKDNVQNVSWRDIIFWMIIVVARQLVSNKCFIKHMHNTHLSPQIVSFWTITLILPQAYGRSWATLESRTGQRLNGAPLKISNEWSTSICLAQSGFLLRSYLWFVLLKVSLKKNDLHINLTSHSYIYNPEQFARILLWSKRFIFQVGWSSCPASLLSLTAWTWGLTACPREAWRRLQTVCG